MSDPVGPKAGAAADDLVLLRVIESPAETAVIRSLLDDAEIPYLLKKPKAKDPLQLVRNLVPDSGFLIGPVEVWVHAGRREEAEELLSPA